MSHTPQKLQTTVTDYRRPIIAQQHLVVDCGFVKCCPTAPLCYLKYFRSILSSETYHRISFTSLEEFWNFVLNYVYLFREWRRKHWPHVMFIFVKLHSGVSFLNNLHLIWLEQSCGLNHPLRYQHASMEVLVGWIIQRRVKLPSSELRGGRGFIH